jgi:hypothetical protein
MTPRWPLPTSPDRKPATLKVNVKPPEFQRFVLREALRFFRLTAELLEDLDSLVRGVVGPPIAAPVGEHGRLRN